MSTANPNPEERQRMVDGALKEFKEKHKPDEVTEEMQVLERGREVVKQTLALCREVRKADESQGGTYNEDSMIHMVMKTYKDTFATWSKDELHYLLCALHTRETIAMLREE